ncbi:hypothetical protein [Bosea sp. (in: a-proteobacteria)]|uniref:hypothetical protein n=1 Tax=Bosea sp. (in: a-proteobacteria) TaxID=1871050 RepID=UPI00263905F7|nr:hypothetical protein [Bosea sp. (in: a-proteobacteria)]MCO5092703.1 hypothetical protein [Bosea sp. (in: a-proteobacteria)]
MPQPRQSTDSALATGVEAQIFAARLVTMHAEASLTIAMRMPLLMKGAFGDSRGQREAAKAVIEKMLAVVESSFAATQATTAFWWSFTLNPTGRFDLTAAAVRVADSTLEPFARRTRANATRLGRFRR